MISQYDKDMCCLYIAEGMSYIWQQRWNQELSRILESLADRKLMKRVHGGYAITLKGLLAVKVWRLHLFLGSSPHVRGALKDEARFNATAGIIPACAGSTPHGGVCCMVQRDHPRMCGEHAFRSAWI